MKQDRRVFHRKPLSNQIRRYRMKRHLSQREVARLIGHRQAGHVSAWEAGRRLPTLRSALKLSGIINCPVEVLFSPLFHALRNEIIDRRRRSK